MDSHQDVDGRMLDRERFRDRRIERLLDEITALRALLEPADKMAEGIRRAVASGAIDSRSMAADGELIYRARREDQRLG